MKPGLQTTPRPTGFPDPAVQRSVAMSEIRSPDALASTQLEMF